MSRRFSVFVAIVVVGCSRPHPPAPSPEAGEGPHPPAPSPEAGEGGAEPSASTATNVVDAGDDESAYLTGVPKVAKAIGHTSVVFKVELSTGKKAAFKPASRRGPVRYRGEIAARRLGVALGIPNVPRAYFRTFEASALSAANGGGEMIVKGGVVKGALVPWIDGLAFLELERAPLSVQWKQWLRRGETIPDDQKELARQISTLVAFDFVTANWDRWSGGNVGIDKPSGTLLFIDNDGAFFDVPPREGLERNEKLLDGVDKFSRSFIDEMKELDEGAMKRALGEETAGVPLLSEKALAGVLQRRKQLLQLVDAKASDAGADATFAFP
ncbi:MAG: hypothetical protein JWP87_3563 [Labilithrix sp.]|nr:hypothetical protein [Labilithrix sp.]